MAYRTLGFRNVAGALDTTRQNPGNWTVAVTDQILNVNIAEFELYKLICRGAAQAATFNVYINNGLWDLAVFASSNSWSAINPMKLHPGDDVFFYYSTPASDGHQPLITVWLRYDLTVTQVYGQ